MKKILIAFNIAIWSLVAFEVAHAAETKKVCVKDDKTGKETCKTMKVHKKLEGTPAPKK